MVHTAARPGNKKRPAAKIKRRREQTAAKSRTMSGGKSVLWGLTGASRRRFHNWDNLDYKILQ